MSEHGTTSNTEKADIDGRYIQFQTSVLRNLPRPHQINREAQETWINSGKALGDALTQALLPPVSPCLRLVKTHKVNGVKDLRPKTVFTEFMRPWAGPDARDRISDYQHSSQDGIVRVMQPARGCSYLDAFIALGARKTVEWGDIYQLLLLQRNGEEGALSRRGHNYFFTHYIHAPDGEYCFDLSWWKSERQWHLIRHELTETRFLYEQDRIFVR